MLVALSDENRALAFKRDGAPCIASIRKLRLDSSDEELVLDDVSLKARSPVTRRQRLSGSCAYDVLAESDAELEELPEPTGGYRGVEHPIKERRPGERAFYMKTRARGVVLLAVLAECERETRTPLEISSTCLRGRPRVPSRPLVFRGIGRAAAGGRQRLHDDLVRLIFGSKNLNAQQRQRRSQAVLEAASWRDSISRTKRSRRASPWRRTRRLPD